MRRRFRVILELRGILTDDRERIYLVLRVLQGGLLLLACIAETGRPEFDVVVFQKRVDRAKYHENGQEGWVSFKPPSLNQQKGLTAQNVNGVIIQVL